MSIPAVVGSGGREAYCDAVRIKGSTSSRRKPLTSDEKAVCLRLRRIWDLRAEALGLTQERAGELLGCSQGAVAHFLNGRNRLHVEATFWFADMLQVNPLEIDPTLGQRIPPSLLSVVERIPYASEMAFPIGYSLRKPAIAGVVHEPPKRN